MGFVKSKEEIKEIQDLLANGRYTTQSLDVEFETTAEFLKEVLPPCFQQPEEPVAYANISKWQSTVCGDFSLGMIYLPCKYKTLEGTTILAIFMDGDMQVTFGREMTGEGRKMGKADMFFDGNSVYAYAERNGTRLIQIDATLGSDLGPSHVEGYAMELKAQPCVTGKGLQNDVVLNVMSTKCDYEITKEGTGTLELRGTVFDPLDTVPALKVRGIYYSEGSAIWATAFYDEFSDRDAYLPYIYGQKYDDLRLFHKAPRYQNTKPL